MYCHIPLNMHGRGVDRRKWYVRENGGDTVPDNAFKGIL